MAKTRYVCKTIQYLCNTNLVTIYIFNTEIAGRQCALKAVFNRRGLDNFVDGDVQISKDYSSFTNTSKLPEHLGNGIYKLELTAEEMTAANIVITIISQASPKDWEDQGSEIDTFGNNENAYIDLDEYFLTSLNSILMEDLESPNPSSAESMIYAINFLYALGRNKIETTSTKITVYKNDGVTKVLTSTIGDDGTTFTKGELG